MSSLNFSGKSPFRRGHSRSLSHPFPSPFGGLGKKRDKHIIQPELFDSGDDDDDDDDFGVGYAHLRPSGSPRKDSARAVPEHDFVTGKCMTCNSTMRRPRNVKIFRCTTCLAVNDLEPVWGSKETPPTERSGKNKSLPAPPAAKVQRKGARFLSLDHDMHVNDLAADSALSPLLFFFFFFFSFSPKRSHCLSSERKLLWRTVSLHI